MKVLIDGDIIVYRSAFAAQSKDKETGDVIVQPEAIALYNVQQMIIKIISQVRSNLLKTEIYLTEKNDATNFRKQLFRSYKANRSELERPYHYDTLREHLLKHEAARIVSKYEADDMLCMRQYECSLGDFHQLERYSIIASIDKDLDQVPGWHYNFVKDQIYYQSPVQAMRCFYKQLLIGDPVDNIPRIKERWRSKNAFAQIDLASTEQEMVNVVISEVDLLYGQSISKEAQMQLIESRGQLLWLKRHENDFWRLPCY